MNLLALCTLFLTRLFYLLLAHEHRNEDGEFVIGQMEHLECTSTFKVFEPHAEYREVCPKILVVCEGEHSHFVPLPTKTPPPIRDTIMKLLEDLGPDLPDITPRRFLRHSIIRDYLAKKFPNIHTPTLADLHVSLANREHVRAYIKQAVQEFYPHGTGWKGN